MASRCWQEWKAQNVSGGVLYQGWGFRDFDTLDELRTYFNAQLLAGTIPVAFQGLPIDLPGIAVADLGGKVWKLTIPFRASAGNIIAPGPGTATQKAAEHGGDGGANLPVARNISYVIEGQTQHITQSIETIQKVATGADVPRNFGRAIGVDPKDKSVAGCDVHAGEVSFTVTIQIPDASFTGAYATVMENLLCHPEHNRACVNDAAFFGYDAGEVLIRTAQFDDPQGGYRRGSFRFSVKRNKALVTVSDDPLLRLANVRGWSYVWVTYAPQTQVVGGVSRPAVLPFEAYEERVYPEGDFSALKLEFYRVAVPS